MKVCLVVAADKIDCQIKPDQRFSAIILLVKNRLSNRSEFLSFTLMVVVKLTGNTQSVMVASLLNHQPILVPPSKIGKYQ